MSLKFNSSVLKEWLSDFKHASGDNYVTFAQKYLGNIKLYSDINKLFADTNDVEFLCNHICSMANIGVKNEKIMISVLDMLPILIKHYLILANQPFKTKNKFDNSILTLKSCLILLCKLLKPSIKKDSFKMDAFNKGSIYHKALARPDLSLWNWDVGMGGSESISKETTDYSQYSLSDCQIISQLLTLYYQNIYLMSSISLNDFCLMTTRVCSSTERPRINIGCVCDNKHTMLLLILLNVVYYILFKDEHATFAIQSIKAIEYRAEAELIAPVLLVLEAIQTSLVRFTPKNHPFEGPIGIHTFIKKESTVATITNATFKPEKLPEDITQRMASLLKTLHTTNDQDNNNQEQANDNNHSTTNNNNNSSCSNNSDSDLDSSGVSPMDLDKTLTSYQTYDAFDDNNIRPIVDINHVQLNLVNGTAATTSTSQIVSNNNSNQQQQQSYHKNPHHITVNKTIL